MRTTSLETSKTSLSCFISMMALSALACATSACDAVDKDDLRDWLNEHKTPEEPVNPCAYTLCKEGTQCVVNKTNPPTAQCVVIDEPPPNSRCTSSTQCPAGLTCSTERGDCQGCGAPEGRICPAVCYGVCEKTPPKSECQTDADCQILESYCGGCECLAARSRAGVLDCTDPVACLVAPCQGKTAACEAGQCVVRPIAPRACITSLEGGETSCKPASLWKQYAAENCRAQGQTLTAISTGTPCGGDNFRYMKYECCLPM